MPYLKVKLLGDPIKIFLAVVLSRSLSSTRVARLVTTSCSPSLGVVVEVVGTIVHYGGGIVSGESLVMVAVAGAGGDGVMVMMMEVMNHH